jgi:hypothetical protein
MENYKQLSQTEKQTFWQKHITAWKKSGLSQDVYCRNQKIKKSTLGYWITKLSREKGFVEVPVNLPSVNEVEITINKNIRIQLLKGYSPELVTRLLKTLEETSYVR